MYLMVRNQLVLKMMKILRGAKAFWRMIGYQDWNKLINGLVLSCELGYWCLFIWSEDGGVMRRFNLLILLLHPWLYS